VLAGAWIACGLLLGPLVPGALALAATVARDPSLAFGIDLGNEINAFVRQGEVAAHLVLRSGTDPRLLVAFPAGDSGVAVWFTRTPRPVTWTLIGSPHAVMVADAKGRSLRGIEADAQLDADALEIHEALLSSVRVLRDHAAGAPIPRTVLTSPSASGDRLVWSRNRLDGAPGYRLSIEVLDGGSARPGRLTSGPSRRLHLRVLAATGEEPLTPLAGDALLAAAAAPESPAASPARTREREVLEFLSYRQKFLAGSWRFDTYFGRDTLMSLTLLSAVLQPEAMESGLRSVLARLAPDGEVAHEEAIGEYAIIENEASGRGSSAAPVYDYGMVDESFMLAPVAARWLLDAPAGRRGAAAFLARRVEPGGAAGAALVRNLLWVIKRTAAFAAQPGVQHLIGLEPGHPAGNWRDSREGLAGGRYPYDVNAVFAPAALRAIDRLSGSGLLDPYLASGQRELLRGAGAQARVWERRVPPLFRVSVPSADARRDLTTYARALGIDAAPALATIDDRPVTFEALALDAAGRPIPVLHSDVGFALLFGSPSPAELRRMLDVLRPFPAGLVTPVGVLVADPAYASLAIQRLLTSTAYHGTVIWSWQQAVLEAGLDRQLARSDLTADLRSHLTQARDRIGSLIRATARYRTAELWTWTFADGRYRVAPFEGQGGRAEEADAAQLWSTVFLALGPHR
jgi:hypothetical protein